MLFGSGTENCGAVLPNDIVPLAATLGGIVVGA